MKKISLKWLPQPVHPVLSVIIIGLVIVNGILVFVLQRTQDTTPTRQQEIAQAPSVPQQTTQTPIPTYELTPTPIDSSSYPVLYQKVQWEQPTTEQLTINIEQYTGNPYSGFAHASLKVTNVQSVLLAVNQSSAPYYGDFRMQLNNFWNYYVDALVAQGWIEYFPDEAGGPTGTIRDFEKNGHFFRLEERTYSKVIDAGTPDIPTGYRFFVEYN